MAKNLKSIKVNKEEAINELETKTWKFARTMPNNPHFYTLRETWPDEKRFEEIVLFIRKEGDKEKFWRKWYKVLYGVEYKYWTMGSPLNETTLINKAKYEIYNPNNTGTGRVGTGESIIPRRDSDNGLQQKPEQSVYRDFKRLF